MSNVNAKQKRINELTAVVLEFVKYIEYCYENNKKMKDGKLNGADIMPEYAAEHTHYFKPHGEKVGASGQIETRIGGRSFDYTFKAGGSQRIINEPFINDDANNIVYSRHDTNNNITETRTLKVVINAHKKNIRYTPSGMEITCTNKTPEENEIRTIVTKYWEHLDDALVIETKKKLESSKNIILRGAPGTGKTYLAKDVAAKLTGLDRDKLEGSEQFEFVQFHPSYDYTDFVEGIRPKIENTESDSLQFEYRHGIFMDFVKKAKRAKNEVDNTINENAPKYVFVIDEINRGEISKILGELFFSIDPGYRGKDGKVKTQYANMHGNDKDNSFYIPDNVYIIGTMNDIDRSVDTFDFAMRRRFRFLEIKATDTMPLMFIKNLEDDKVNDAADCLVRLNDAIYETDGLNENYHIGPSYFLKLDENSVKYDYDVLWAEYLEPLIKEYLRGDEIKMREDLKKIHTAYKLDIKDTDKLCYEIIKVFQDSDGNVVSKADVLKGVHDALCLPEKSIKDSVFTSRFNELHSAGCFTTAKSDNLELDIGKIPNLKEITFKELSNVLKEAKATAKQKKQNAQKTQTDA